MHIKLYGHVCRVCMCKANNLHSLNEIIVEYSLPISKMLEKLLSGIHKHHTHFPLSEEICEGCMDHLQVAYRFQQTCLATYQEMYKIWKNAQLRNSDEMEVAEEDVMLNNTVDMDPIKIEKCMDSTKFEKSQYSLQGEQILTLDGNDHAGPGKMNEKTSHNVTGKHCPEIVESEKTYDEDEENVPLSSLRKNSNSNSKDNCNSNIVQDTDEGKECLKIDPGASIKCSSCNRFFKYAHHLAKHKCTLTTNRKCEICCKEFSNANLLQKHKRSKHKNVGACKTKMKKIKNHDEVQTNLQNELAGCGASVSEDVVDLQRNIDSNDIGNNDHLLDEEDENEADDIAEDNPLLKANEITPPAINVYSCNQCNACFRFEKQLERHLKKHTEAHRFVCLVCSDRFKYPFMLHKHVEKHHPEENSKTLKESLGTENRKDNSEKSHICKYCPSAYTNVGGLAQHMSKKHPDIIPFKCDKCDKTFVVEEHLKIHTNRHMGIKNFKCELCDKSFSFKFAMKQHMRIHTGDLNYLCTLCGKKFYRPSNLRQHMQRHGDDKPYTCPHCPKRFKCPSDRYIHLMSHQEGKNHVCSTCGSRFSRVDTLHQHQILHTGQKPYKCDQCPMAFPRLMNLNRHLRTHTGEKPYKCKYCEKAYAQSNDLNKHLRTHLGENTYMCGQCPAAFKYQADLRNHEWEHYRKQRDEEENRATKSEDLMNEIALKASTLIGEVQ